MFAEGAGGRGFCPNAWIVFEGSCYLFADEANVSWTEAINFCQSHRHAHRNAHLVTVETRAEDMFIKDTARRLFKSELGTRNSFWMGASDLEVEGPWRWYPNHQMLNYTSFYSVAESHTPDQDCLILWGAFNMGWGDYYCALQIHAIC
ncbi:hypothetical protein DPMN_096596 [Dreissena polymorpha]|uniref:C-type lectin domain-containing protein n=1 Tax=Dreissena polymorpha TaxID=45954 RepID=A0A9D4R4W5_DREPO|nr:hypothetical protein DPMN_096596 [Dreissena polymorpha]